MYLCSFHSFFKHLPSETLTHPNQSIIILPHEVWGHNFWSNVKELSLSYPGKTKAHFIYTYGKKKKIKKNNIR